MPIRPSPSVETVFEGRLHVAQGLYNKILAEYLRRIDRRNESVEYRRLQGERRTAAAEERSKGRKRKGYKPTPNPRLKVFADPKERGLAWSALNQRFGLQLDTVKAALTADGLKWLEHDKSQMIKLIADQRLTHGLNAIEPHIIRHVLEARAKAVVKKHLEGKGGRPSFRTVRFPLDSIESSSSDKNKGGIRFDAALEQVFWRGPKGERIVSAKVLIDRFDFMIKQSLKRDICLVKIVRKRISKKKRWFVQLTLEGTPPIKRIAAIQETIGLDLGTQHAAVASTNSAAIFDLVPRNLKEVQKKRRSVQKAMARSLRAINPEAIKIDESGRPHGFKKGVRLVKSKRWSTLKTEHNALMRKSARIREIERGKIVNSVLAMGTDIRIEKLSYLGWQKAHGRTTERTAPGAFIAHLKRRAKLYNGQAVEIPVSFRLSQLCVCGVYTKQPLNGPIASRVHCCECGITPPQRDLYSAFLASFVDAGGSSVDLQAAQSAWGKADQVLSDARRKYQASDGTGLRIRRDRSLDRPEGLHRKSRKHQNAQPGKVAASVREFQEGVAKRSKSTQLAFGFAEASPAKRLRSPRAGPTANAKRITG